MTHSGHDCGAFGYGEQRNSPSKNVIFLLIPDVALGGGSSHEAAGIVGLAGEIVAAWPLVAHAR